MQYRAPYAAERLPILADPGEVPAARELLVLQLLARGYSDAQIATVLGCTGADVEAFITSAAEQLGVTTRYEAVASAVQRGLIV